MDVGLADCGVRKFPPRLCDTMLRAAYDSNVLVAFFSPPLELQLITPVPSEAAAADARNYFVFAPHDLYRPRGTFAPRGQEERPCCGRASSSQTPFGNDQSFISGLAEPLPPRLWLIRTRELRAHKTVAQSSATLFLGPPSPAGSFV